MVIRLMRFHRWQSKQGMSHVIRLNALCVQQQNRRAAFRSFITLV
jgi:hypothetical protein